MPAANPATTSATTVPDLDLSVVVGTLSSDPTITELASGSRLHRYEVTARHPAGTDSVPVAWFDPARPPALVAGDRVAVVGRVRRRFFRVGGTTRSATEVVASSVRRGTNARQVAKALADTLAALET